MAGAKERNERKDHTVVTQANTHSQNDFFSHKTFIYTVYDHRVSSKIMKKVRNKAHIICSLLGRHFVIDHSK